MHDSVKGSGSFGQLCMIQSRAVARYRAAMHDSVKGSGTGRLQGIKAASQWESKEVGIKAVGL
jgi:hypothetical protein